MMNTNYAPEIASAYRFVTEHNTDYKLMALLKELESPKYTHSSRWSIIYDFMAENYPEKTGTLITGLAYFIEN